VGTLVSKEKARGEEVLVKEGRSKQFLRSGAGRAGARVSYASMGLEVHLEPVQVKDLACSECDPPRPSATVEDWYVIYTPPKPEEEHGTAED